MNEQLKYQYIADRMAHMKELRDAMDAGVDIGQFLSNYLHAMTDEKHLSKPNNMAESAIYILAMLALSELVAYINTLKDALTDAQEILDAQENE